MALTPSLQAIRLADNVTRDEATGKVTVTGMFDEIVIEHPSTTFSASACLFFSLRDVRGRVDLELVYVDLSTHEVLISRPMPFRCDDPMEVTDVMFNLPRVPVPHPGVYAWELHHEGVMIGSCRVTARINGRPDG